MNSETIEKQRKTFPEPSKIEPEELWDTKRPSGTGRISWIGQMSGCKTGKQMPKWMFGGGAAPAGKKMSELGPPTRVYYNILI